VTWFVLVQVKNKHERYMPVWPPRYGETSRLGSRDKVAIGSSAGRMVARRARRSQEWFLSWATEPRPSRDDRDGLAWRSHLVCGIYGGLATTEGSSARRIALGRSNRWTWPVVVVGVEKLRSVGHATWSQGLHGGQASLWSMHIRSMEIQRDYPKCPRGHVSYFHVLMLV
jgi:hypothetical protein